MTSKSEENTTKVSKNNSSRASAAYPIAVELYIAGYPLP